VKRATAWAPLAAAAWALAFAAVSFYWAAGGEVGLETVGEEIERDALAREPDAIALVWVTGGLKVVGAALALALVRPREPAIVRRAVGLAGWVVGSMGSRLAARRRPLHRGRLALPARGYSSVTRCSWAQSEICSSAGMRALPRSVRA
jgi:Protein of unknown function (DUF3995)